MNEYPYATSTRLFHLVKHPTMQEIVQKHNATWEWQQYGNTNKAQLVIQLPIRHDPDRKTNTRREVVQLSSGQKGDTLRNRQE